MTELIVATGAPVEDSFSLDNEEFDEKGVTCVRQAVSPAEVDVLRREVDTIMTLGTTSMRNHTERNNGTQGRFVATFNSWKDRPELGAFCRTSRVPELVASLTGSDRVNFYFDQAFVKEPGTVDPTPWHADQPFWPILGKKVVTVWIALDRVTKDSGAVEFVGGSHKWNRWFQSKAFSGENDLTRNEKFEEMPDIEGNRDQYDIISWDMEPGDALVFSAMTLHGAPGNASSERRRRGLALRYTGDDVTYDPRNGATQKLFCDNLKPGGPLDSDDFPVVWPRHQ